MPLAITVPTGRSAMVTAALPLPLPPNGGLMGNSRTAATTRPEGESGFAALLAQGETGLEGMPRGLPSTAARMAADLPKGPAPAPQDVAPAATTSATKQGRQQDAVPVAPAGNAMQPVSVPLPLPGAGMAPEAEAQPAKPRAAPLPTAEPKPQPSAQRVGTEPGPEPLPATSQTAAEQPAATIPLLLTLSSPPAALPSAPAEPGSTGDKAMVAETKVPQDPARAQQAKPISAEADPLGSPTPNAAPSAASAEAPDPSTSRLDQGKPVAKVKPPADISPTQRQTALREHSSKPEVTPPSTAPNAGTPPAVSAGTPLAGTASAIAKPQLGATTSQHTVRHVAPAAQIAPAFVVLTLDKSATPRLTLRLDPGELGQVEVRIERAEGRPAEVKVLAERPETLALLQRDASELGRALQQAGMPPENCRLSFDLASGQNSGRDWSDGQPKPGGQQGQREGGGQPRPGATEAASGPRNLLGLLDIAV
jgi:flagellar hook-length control protein FliK